MARPRTHDIDALLDAAERLLAEHGGSGLTIRALAESTGASSGSLYHAFGSRSDLLGQMWLRAATRFLELQEQAIGDLDGGQEAAIEATVAVASVPARIRAEHPDTATLLLRFRRDEILDQDLSPELRRRLERLDRRLLEVLRRLADGLWGRHDRPAVETVAVCVVDLPTAILINRRERIIDPLAALEAAIRGVIHGSRQIRGESA
ncbi:MAG: TetR/AcrR family transcriptional regulator [Solirubrobacterales bacterium]|nr:TetR/AcrR family transcriptional regulator [Solirubrobacterales bacterium]